MEERTRALFLYCLSVAKCSSSKHKHKQQCYQPTTVTVNAFEWNLLFTVEIKYGPNLHYWALLLLLLENLTQFNLITPIYLFGTELEGIQGESTQWHWVFLQLQWTSEAWARRRRRVEEQVNLFLLSMLLFK